MHPLNITGERFGKLVAIEPTLNRKERGGYVIWLCHCDCGNDYLVSVDDLKWDRVHSCGCLRKELAAMKFQDIAGQRFGKLVAIRFIEKKDDMPYWLCKCDCGSEKIIRLYSLVRNKTKSCGCLRKERNWGIFGEASFNRVWYNYKKSERRGVIFDLTKEQLREITSQNCHYCGIPPRQIPAGRCSNNGGYIHNGIDRVDSSKGYTLDNCVPCCSVCNIAKHDMGIDDFYAWIERVYKFSKSKNCVREQESQYLVAY